MSLDLVIYQIYFKSSRPNKWPWRDALALMARVICYVREQPLSVKRTLQSAHVRYFIFSEINKSSRPQQVLRFRFRWSMTNNICLEHFSEKLGISKVEVTIGTVVSKCPAANYQQGRRLDYIGRQAIWLYRNLQRLLSMDY